MSQCRHDAIVGGDRKGTKARCCDCPKVGLDLAYDLRAQRDAAEKLNEELASAGVHLAAKLAHAEMKIDDLKTQVARLQAAPAVSTDE